MFKKIIVFSSLFVFSIYPAAMDHIHKTVLRGHTHPVTSVSFNSRGDRVLTVSEFDRTAKVWDLNGTCLATLEGHEDSVSSAEFNHSGDRIVTASWDTTAKIWHETKPRDQMRAFTMALDSRLGEHSPANLVDGYVSKWIAEHLEGHCLATCEGHLGHVYSAAFNNKGDRIVTAGNYPIVKVWDLEGHCLATLEGHRSHVLSAAFNASDDRIVTASWDGTAKVWDLNGTCLATCEGHNEHVFSAVFNNRGDRIVTVPRVGAPRVWDLEGHCKAILTGHDMCVFTAEFNKNGDRIVTASWDGTARVWDLEGHCLITLVGHTAEVCSASFNNSDDRIVTSSCDGTARVWDLEGHCLAVFASQIKGVLTTAVFNNSGDRILATSCDGTAIIWHDSRPGSQMRAFTMALHPRLGEHSPAGLIDGYVAERIGEYVCDQAFEPASTSVQRVTATPIRFINEHRVATSVVCGVTLLAAALRHYRR
jgi:WD40 repeat protein